MRKLLFLWVALLGVSAAAGAQSFTPEQIQALKNLAPGNGQLLTKNELKKITQQIQQQEEKASARQAVSLVPLGNYSYKMQMFSAGGYTAKNVLAWLPSFIARLPQNRQALFERASQILAQQQVPHAPRQPAALTQQEAFAHWTAFLDSAHPTELNAGKGNPFAWPEMQNARVILIGEDHTMHYPTEQLVEYMIAYNKSAPADKRITHLFVEFAYQANVAMEFIRAHIRELPEKELLKQAVQYARKQLKGKYIPATLREEVRWLRLGYRLLQENTDVVFYAYDIPSPSIKKRNAAAMAFLQAGYEQPGTKMVFIGGALHVLRENLNTPLLGDRAINAQNSLANTPGIAPEDIVSIIAVGGTPWANDNQLYGGSQVFDLYHILLVQYKDKHQNLAFKTPAKQFGFDYYFYFDTAKKPVVTDANSW